MSDDLERRIAERAYEIWEREGCPEGRALDHWILAREEIAITDNQSGTLLPAPARDARSLRDEPVEPAFTMENLGDMPGMTDQGEESQPPRRPGR